VFLSGWVLRCSAISSRGWLLGYLVSGMVYFLGYKAKEIINSYFARVTISVMTLITSGAVWVVATFVGAGLESTGSSVAQLAVLGAGLQLTCGALIALILYSQQAAVCAEETLRTELMELNGTEAALKDAETDARRELKNWVVHHLIPGINRIEKDLMSNRVTPSELDRFRESVIKRTSWRIHPRVVNLGARAALTAVMRSRGIDQPVVGIAPGADNSLSEDELVALARCLDIILLSGIDIDNNDVNRVDSAARNRGIRVELTVTGDAVILEIQGLSNNVTKTDLKIPELLARLKQHGGHAYVDASGSVLLVLRADATSSISPVDPHLVSIPAVAGSALAIATFCIGELTTGRVVTAISLALVAGLLILWLRIVPAWMAVALTSFGVSALWAVFMNSSLDTTLVFFTANTIVVIASYVAAVYTKSLLTRWFEHVQVQRMRTDSVRKSCSDVSEHIDELRSAIGRVLHSQIQARLVVAVGCIVTEPTDIHGALRAVHAIQQIDVPRLINIINGDDRGEDFNEFLNELSSRTDVHISFAVEGDIPALHQGAVRGIIEEGLANAIHHGNAQQIKVKINSNEQSSRIALIDDGCGPVSRFESGLGLTLIGMATGGNWHLNRSDSGGAELIAQVDL